jgi:acyl-coenzyme A thioesterase PaaI-like protein
MARMFGDLFGYRIANKKNESIVSVSTRKEMVNIHGTIHGAISYGICNKAMLEAIGADLMCINSSIEYYLPAFVGDDLYATGEVVKDGNTVVYAKASLYHNDILIAGAYGAYSRESLDKDTLEPTGTVGLSMVHPILTLGSYENDVESKMDNLYFMQLFSRKTNQINRIKSANGKVSFSLQTEDIHQNERGFIDDSLIIALCDSSIGAAALSLGYRAVTIKLSLQLFEPTKPGVVITTSSEVYYRSGKAIQALSWVWADSKVIGLCTGGFFTAEIVDLNKIGQIFQQ